MALLMHENGITANVISWRAVISKGDQPAQALALLLCMHGTGITADVIRINAAISACEKGESGNML